MSFLSSLPKVLIDVAIGLLKIKADDRTRQRLADLLCSVADCVSAIADNIQAGIHSVERCAELNAYISHLEGFVAKETDSKTARQLTFWLNHVAEVPGIAEIDLGKMIESEAYPKWSKHRRFEQSIDVKEVAGIIRGVGNLLRV